MLASGLIALTANGWSALGIWLTLAVYIALALFAKRQLSEARDLRIQQSRPFVVVDVVNDDIVLFLSVKNIGSTVARNLTVRFNRPVRTDQWLLATWTYSQLFTEGMAALVPGRELRFALGAYLGGDAIEKRIAGKVAYDGPAGFSRGAYSEDFFIDIAALDGSHILRDPLVQQLGNLVEAVQHLKPNGPPFGWPSEAPSGSETVQRLPENSKAAVGRVRRWLTIRAEPSGRSRAADRR